MYHYSSSNLYYRNRRKEQNAATISYNRPGQIKNPLCSNSSKNGEDCLNDLKCNPNKTVEQTFSSPPDQEKNSNTENDQFLSEEIESGDGIMSEFDESLAGEEPGWKPVENSALHESNSNPEENNIVVTLVKEFKEGDEILLKNKAKDIYKSSEGLGSQVLDQLPEAIGEDKIKLIAQQIIAENCSCLRTELEIKMLNQMQTLEERICQLESQVKLLLDNHKRLALPKTITLEGSMITNCGCGCAKGSQ